MEQETLGRSKRRVSRGEAKDLNLDWAMLEKRVEGEGVGLRLKLMGWEVQQLSKSRSRQSVLVGGNANERKKKR